MLADYHLHTCNSFDGKQNMDDLCRAAILNGLEEIAVTEHMDIYKGRPYGYILDCKKTFDDIDLAAEKYKGQIRIKKGIELGQPMRNPVEYAKFIKEWPVDFIIGSVHNMEGDVDVGEYDYSSLDFKSFFTNYLECILDFARYYEYDVLGHVTYPMRYMKMQVGSCPDPMEFSDIFEEIFYTVIARGKGIELNTSSIARGTGELMPTVSLLKLYKDLGGKIITVGSDAHVSSQVGGGVRTGMGILKDLGFKCAATYRNRQVVLNLL